MPDVCLERLIEIAQDLGLPEYSESEGQEAFRVRVMGSLWETTKSLPMFEDTTPSSDPQATFMNQMLQNLKKEKFS